MVSVKVDVTREVDFDALLTRAMTNMFNRCMLAVHESAAQPGTVPIDTGLLRASLSPGANLTMIDPGVPPTWARVWTNVPYAGMLDAPEKSVPHYRGGPSAGQLTEGWFSVRALDGARKKMGAAVNLAIDEIEAGWKAGS